jgi:predicted O-methyltransferase YrrM
MKSTYRPDRRLSRLATYRDLLFGVTEPGLKASTAVVNPAARVGGRADVVRAGRSQNIGNLGAQHMTKSHPVTFMIRYSALLLATGLLLSNALAQRAGGRPGGRQGDEQLERPPVAKTDAERKVFDILTDIRARQSYRNVPPEDGRLLRLLTESMGAKHVVEIGTSTGYSGIWIGLALQKTGGKLTTYEIDAQRAATARANFERAGMSDVIVLIEGDAHEEVPKLNESIDILFLDADKQGYIDYLDKLLPLVRPGGLVVAHNITPGMADPDYMTAINTNPDLETIVRSGVGITLKKR